MKNTDLESIRREYGDRALLEVDAPNEPLVLLKQWLQQAIDADNKADVVKRQNRRIFRDENKKVQD